MGCYLFWFAFHPPSPRHQDDLTAEVRVHLSACGWNSQSSQSTGLTGGERPVQGHSPRN